MYLFFWYRKIGLKKNPIAKKIKIADIKHNLDETRLEKVTLKDIARRNKYKKALEILEGKSE